MISLGFFIAPLFSISFGIFIQKDQTDWLKKVAIVLALIGVGYQIYVYQKLPALSLIMAMCFSLYALCKKYCRFDLLVSVTIENLMIAPFACLYLAYLFVNHEGQFLYSGATTFWLTKRCSTNDGHPLFTLYYGDK